MNKIFPKTIALVGSSGSDYGYGHLRRLVSLSAILEYENTLCLHGNFEKTNEFYQIIEGSRNLILCKCNSNPDTVIIDSYDIKVLSKIRFKNSPKLIQIIDELSPKLWANAYIEASPTLNWRPLNRSANIKKFRNNPILRREFFSNLYSRTPRISEIDSILVLTGSSNLSRQVITYLSEIFSYDIQGYKLTIATNDQELGKFSKSLGFHVVPFLNDFQNLTKDYKLIVSACGVTAWELLKLQCNCVLLSLADNQDLQLQYLKANFNVGGLKFDLNNSLLKTELIEVITKSLSSSKEKTINLSPSVDDGAVAAVVWLKDLNYI